MLIKNGLDSGREPSAPLKSSEAQLAPSHPKVLVPEPGLKVPMTRGWPGATICLTVTCRSANLRGLQSTSANRSDLLSAMTAAHRSPPQINLRNEDRWPGSAAGCAGSHVKPADGATDGLRPHTPPGAVVSLGRRLVCLACVPSTTPGAMSLSDKSGESEEWDPSQVCALSQNHGSPGRSPWAGSLFG